MKTAFITGITGQDGAYLSKNLLEKGYKVYGGIRRLSSPNPWRLDYLNVTKDIEFVDMDLTDPYVFEKIAKDVKPDEWYNLAAMSFVAHSFEIPYSTLLMDGASIIHQLEAIKRYSPDTKFYQASTSELYGKVLETPQKETTPFYPRSPYGIAKLAAYWYVVNYRESYDIFASNGILFNHESPLRGIEFVTKKVVNHLSKYFKGEVSNPLEIGNMYSKRDWGHSKDYVEAMTLILQANKPQDFVVSTGETHSTKEFIELAVKFKGKDIIWEGEGVNEIGKIDGKVVVKVNPKFFRPCEVDLLLGDNSKIRKELKWKPIFTFETLVEDMMKAEDNFKK